MQGNVSIGLLTTQRWSRWTLDNTESKYWELDARSVTYLENMDASPRVLTLATSVVLKS